MCLMTFNVDQNDNGYIEERSHFQIISRSGTEGLPLYLMGLRPILVHGHAGIHAEVKFKAKVKFTVTFLVLLIMNQALRDD